MKEEKEVDGRKKEKEREGRRMEQRKEGRKGSSKERETNLNDFKRVKMSPGRCY